MSKYYDKTGKSVDETIISQRKAFYEAKLKEADQMDEYGRLKYAIKIYRAMVVKLMEMFL